jgi:hypothetical protein
MKNAWDNVIFTCNMMQAFKSKEDVSDWQKWSLSDAKNIFEKYGLG